MNNHTPLHKFQFEFPDLSEWKIFYFNQLINEPEIRITVPKYDFIGLYINLGASHCYQLPGNDKKMLGVGEYNFIFLPHDSAQLTLYQGLYSSLCIEFSSSLLKKLKEGFPIIEVLLKCAGRRTPCVLSHRNMIVTSEMQKPIRDILLNQSYEGKLREIVNHSKVMDLLFTSMDNIRALAEARLRSSEIDRAVKVHDYMLQHLKDNFTVDQLAGMVDIDKRKLEKTFKAIYRKGVHRFFLDEKIKHAAILLRETNLPAKQIAREVGFRLGARFSVAFKKFYGCSPREFRKLAIQ